MTMLDAVIKALAQMVSPPFRALLFKAMGLALLLIVLAGIGLHHALIWLASLGENWAEGLLGSTAHAPLVALAWILSVAAGLGIIVGSVFLMPAVTALVGSLFVDDIALEVERQHYPDQPVGTSLPLLRAILQGIRTALLAVAVYLIAVPSLLVAGLGTIIFFIASAYLLGREYFELAAMRYRSPSEAKTLRKYNQHTVFMAGLFIAVFVSIPIVNLATPLFAMALMVHVHKSTMIGGERKTCAGATTGELTPISGRAS
jgi:CysZ protein